MIKIRGNSYEYRIFSDIFSKSLGLMFLKKNNLKNKNLIFIFQNKKERNITIHTFFCDKIYLYFFDEEQKLVDFKELRAFRIYKSKKKWKYLIESFEKIDIEFGEKFIFDN